MIWLFFLTAAIIIPIITAEQGPCPALLGRRYRQGFCLPSNLTFLCNLFLSVALSLLFFFLTLLRKTIFFEASIRKEKQAITIDTANLKIYNYANGFKKLDEVRIGGVGVEGC